MYCKTERKQIRLLVAARYKHTEAAAGYLPGSTLAIKTGGSINMAQLRITMKIYSKDKVEE